MTAVATKGSYGEPMVFTQSTAAGAKTTWLFHLAVAADGTDAVGLTPVVTISKAGAAFGAAGGVVSEISGGWYKIAFTATDLSTLGALGVHVAVATADSINMVHQVIALDHYTATVNPGAGGITAASFAADAVDANALKADAVTEIQAGLATHADVVAVTAPSFTKTVALGTLAADGASTGISGNKALALTLTATGTFGGGTMQVQICANPSAAVPVWVNVAGATLASNGTKTVTLPVGAARWNLSGSTSPSIVCTATVSYAA
jgi:hypothetical protein